MDEPVASSSVVLNGVEVASASGRGIAVALYPQLWETGLYVTGQRTTVMLDQTNVVFNGNNGNTSGGGWRLSSW